MNKFVRGFSACIAFLLVGNCTHAIGLNYDPWGVWNDLPVTSKDNVKVLSFGSYYQNGDSGLMIIKEYSEIASKNEYHGPAFVVTGIFLKIKKQTQNKDGIIFILNGKGVKIDEKSGKRLYRNDTDIEVKMVFLSENECKFEYTKETDDAGFSLPQISLVDKVFRRLPIINK